MLSPDDQKKVQTLVNRFLSPDYDREFIATTIIIRAHFKEWEFISKDYVRKKCASEYHKRQSEKRRNQTMIMPQDYTPTKDEAECDSAIESRERIGEMIKALTPLERMLIWNRFYDEKPIEEICKILNMKQGEVTKGIETALYKMRGFNT